MSINIIKRNIKALIQIIASTRSWVESILNSLMIILFNALDIRLVLTRSRYWALLMIIHFKSLSMRYSPYFRTAPLLKRIKLIALTLHLSNTLFSHLFLIMLLQSLNLFLMLLLFSKYLISRLSQFLPVLNNLITHIIRTWSRHLPLI